LREENERGGPIVCITQIVNPAQTVSRDVRRDVDDTATHNDVVDRLSRKRAHEPFVVKTPVEVFVLHREVKQQRKGLRKRMDAFEFRKNRKRRDATWYAHLAQTVQHLAILRKVLET